ncbi:GGDEF domain-containing protein [Paucibacter sp. R3-3]|uniref:diguanylate cyclase n=1 Tax=Roseateles agri TaxID=3098619 RepID=A0ABU5DRD8_9BURK|nr:GGDEF domain-containing protein [Paucibacter sp. R3-3]MDY0748885.1 GGDEF domain-containing protein [Paucibacter sp. R3-3]
MDLLDAPTLLLVNAVFNGFAAAGWALLAGVFRMAPRASWLMVGAHLFRILQTTDAGLTAGWSSLAVVAFEQSCALAAVCLLALALRRMLRLGRGRRHIALITGAGFLGIVLLFALQQRAGIPLVAAVAITLLALGGARDVISGAGPGLARWITMLLVLPYLVLAGLGIVRLAMPAQGGAVSAGVSAGVGALWLLLTMAISVSLMALLVWRLVGRVEHLTLRDPMTDTLNRRAIADEVQLLQARRERGHDFALVLLDIDHFKRINDELGHAAGDAALLHVVRIVRGCLREADRLGRLGGEEFCALLPYTTTEAAAQVAERIRATLQAQPLVWRGQRVELTASFGVAGGRANDPAGEVSLARADEQVYRAKGEGRNRVCVAPAEAFG